MVKKSGELKSIAGIIPSPKDFPKACRFQDRCEYVFEQCRLKEPLLDKLGEKHFAACYKSGELLNN